MNQAIPAQPPAVVLRSHYVALRTLLAIATVAIVGLTIAVVILAATTNGSPRIAAHSVRVNPTAATAESGARVDHRGLKTSASGSLGTASATSCGQACPFPDASEITITPTLTSGASCGDVCSSYRPAATYRKPATFATPPIRAGAASCGDVCSSYRRAG